MMKSFFKKLAFVMALVHMASVMFSAQAVTFHMGFTAAIVLCTHTIT